MLANFVGIGRGPVNIDAHIAADGPPQLCERLQECRQPNLNLYIICGCGKKHADASHPLILLGACRDRPGGGSASKNEFTPSHYRPQAQWIVAFETRSLKGVTTYEAVYAFGQSEHGVSIRSPRLRASQA